MVLTLVVMKKLSTENLWHNFKTNLFLLLTLLNNFARQKLIIAYCNKSIHVFNDIQVLLTIFHEGNHGYQ